MSQISPSSFCDIYFVRHGETDWNAACLLQGHNDIPLNFNGRTQAAELRERLLQISFAAAFSSDLSRAKQTASIILSSTPIALMESSALRERYAGEFEGKPFIEFDQFLQKQQPFMQTLSKEDYLSYKWHPDVETTTEVYQRVHQFLTLHIPDYLNQSILVVTHGGVLRSILDHLHFTPEQRWIVKNCGFLKIKAAPSHFSLDSHEGVSQRSLV